MDERPVIKTRKERRVDRDDVSCDSYYEEGEEGEEEVGRRECDRRERKRMTRPTRETIVYERV